jgi:hypothetical protein
MILNFKDEHFIDFDIPDEQVLANLKEHLNLKIEGSIVDYILDYCDTTGYRVEEVAELVKKDKVLKNILKQDCIFHGIFENPNKLDEW